LSRKHRSAGSALCGLGKLCAPEMLFFVFKVTSEHVFGEQTVHAKFSKQDAQLHARVAAFVIGEAERVGLSLREIFPKHGVTVFNVIDGAVFASDSPSSEQGL